MQCSYQEYASVVVDVQEAELFPPLLQDDEHCVHEVQDLRQIEHVEDECDGRVLLVECIAGYKSVASGVGADASLDTHVRAEHDLDHVVGKLKRI